MSKKKNKKEKPLDEAELKKQLELKKKAEEEQKLRVEKERIDKEKGSLLNSILEKTKALTPQEKKDKDLEKEALKFKLTGGGSSSIKEEKDKIAQFKQPYIPYFSYSRNDFYKDTYRVKQWDGDYKKYFKVKEMADVTTRLIYGRFNNEVLPKLKEMNPFIAYLVRKYKLFQFLNPDAQKEMVGFINDYDQMIDGYNNWDLFERDYCAKYNLPYQSKLF